MHHFTCFRLGKERTDDLMAGDAGTEDAQQSALRKDVTGTQTQLDTGVGLVVL